MAKRTKRQTRARANVARARARSRAARLGWKRRRERALARSLAAKKAARTRARRAGKRPRPATVTRPAPATGERVDYLISFNFSGGKSGKPYRRDFIVPAPRGTAPAELVKLAQKELPRGAEALAPFLKESNATIFEGPPTTRQKTELR